MNATAEVEEVQSASDLYDAVSLSACYAKAHLDMLIDVSDRMFVSMSVDQMSELQTSIYALCRAVKREIEDIDKRVKAHS